MNKMNIKKERRPEMKLAKKELTGKDNEQENYDQYISLDWSEKTMAVARMRSNSMNPKVIEEHSDIKRLKKYLAAIGGRKILTI